MATSKTKTPLPKTLQAQTKSSADVDLMHVGKDTLDTDAENAAQGTIGRIKGAIPSFDEMAKSLKNETNLDIQSMADDATTFVRRNPAASIAAAAGIGILIGVLATKRS